MGKIPQKLEQTLSDKYANARIAEYGRRNPIFLLWKGRKSRPRT